MANLEKKKYEKLTLDEVKELIRKTLPDHFEKSKPSKKGANGNPCFFLSRDFSMMAALNNYDEVFPGIFLGNRAFAFDKKELQRLGITHLLNAAQGQKFNMIDTTGSYNADLKLEFLGITAIDTPFYKINRHFQNAAEFIDLALKSGGKIVVHCQQGVSRSATLVLAYLMIHQQMSLVEAIKTVRLRRFVFPNDGFIQQLCDFDFENMQKRFDSHESEQKDTQEN